MRAFIFSLDAFVAFTLALIAIYSLIFFSSVPSSYYYTLTQAHFLARDVVVALSTTDCTTDYGACPVTGSLLDNIVHGEGEQQRELIKDTVGHMIPNQFGYSFETSEDNGEHWGSLYDTRTSSDSDEEHAGSGKKLTVSSQMITFGYSAEVYTANESIYRYNSCGGDWIITCDEAYPPAGVELVPEVETILVRITVFI
jgi:hypothetical protein